MAFETKHQRREREAREVISVNISSLGISAIAIQQAIIRVLLAKGALSTEEVAVVFQYAADRCADNPQKPELNRRVAAAARQTILETGRSILDEASAPKH
jgi:hypothetical protein